MDRQPPSFVRRGNIVPGEPGSPTLELKAYSRIIVSPNSTSWFGDLVSDRTYGHIGSTGTMVWMDPEYDLACVLFTNDPTGADILRPKITNAVMGALVQ